MNTRRISAALLSASLLLSASATAADLTHSSEVAPTPAPTQDQKTLRAMFDFADQNKDGQLTPDEARGHLPITYKSFARIDTDQRGWISYEQFVSFTNQRVGKQADEFLKIGQWH